MAPVIAHCAIGRPRAATAWFCALTYPLGHPDVRVYDDPGPSGVTVAPAPVTTILSLAVPDRNHTDGMTLP